MKMLTADLTDEALDYAVAKSNGWVDYTSDSVEQGNTWHLDAATSPRGRILRKVDFNPSTNWLQAGEIIKRENIAVIPPTSRVHRHGGPNAGWGQSGLWTACTFHAGFDGKRAHAWHESNPIIAAMRCFVKSKLGPEVEIPDHLITP